jgi:hypothetical protein
MGHPSICGGLEENGSRWARMPTLATIETVAKMGHPALWLIQMWATRPPGFVADPDVDHPKISIQ